MSQGGETGRQPVDGAAGPAVPDVSRGGVFLTDFGLAKATATGSKYTRTGEALGTPAYMSPEQARGETAALTPATDVWSLGCLLYECLAGRRAFDGESPAEIIGAVLTLEPVPLRRIRPEVPAGVEILVRAVLAKRTADRLASAEALRDDLDRVLRGEQAVARPRRTGHRRTLAVSAAVALGAGVMVIAAPRPEPSRATGARSEAQALALRARGLRNSEPGRAAALLEQALRAEPTRDDWRLERGLLLWASGEAAEARRLWSEIQPGAPEAEAARFYCGLEAFFRLEGGWLQGHRARPDLQSLATRPGRVGRLARGALSATRSRWAEARAALRGETGWEAALLRGYVEGCDPAGDSEAAVREYGNAVDEGIAFAWALYNRGCARQRIGDLAGAIEDYGRALESNPRLGGAHTRRGLARVLQGDYGDAIRDFGRGLEEDPQDATAYCGRGLAWKAQGEFARAIQDFDQALALNPRLAEVYTNRGAARKSQGDLAGAIEDHGRALAVNPRLAEAFSNRAVAREAQGDLAGAVDDFAKALDVAPAGWRHRSRTEACLSDTRAALAAQGDTK